MSNSSSDKGFTLVELAIALMVIGLLIGGVLKGQELIENARVTSTIREIKAYDAAAMIFRNTYNAIPGDIKKPDTRIPDCTDATCNIGGNGNSKIAWNDVAPIGTENHNFTPHLVRAGMIQGPRGGTAAEQAISVASAISPERLLFYLPAKGFDGGWMAVNYYELQPAATRITVPAHYYYPGDNSRLTTGKVVGAIDMKMDDGKPDRGDVFVREIAQFSSTSYVTQDTVTGEYGYNPNSSGCIIVIRSGF